MTIAHALEHVGRIANHVSGRDYLNSALIGRRHVGPHSVELGKISDLQATKRAAIADFKPPVASSSVGGNCAVQRCRSGDI